MCSGNSYNLFCSSCFVEISLWSPTQISRRKFKSDIHDVHWPTLGLWIQKLMQNIMIVFVGCHEINNVQSFSKTAARWAATFFFVLNCKTEDYFLNWILQSNSHVVFGWELGNIKQLSSNFASPPPIEEWPPKTNIHLLELWWATWADPGGGPRGPRPPPPK